MNLDKSPTASLQTELTAAKARIVELEALIERWRPIVNNEQELRIELSYQGDVLERYSEAIARAQSAEAEAARLREALEFMAAPPPLADSTRSGDIEYWKSCAEEMEEIANAALHPIHKETT